MRVAILTRFLDPPSLRIYREQVMSHLQALGIRFVPFRTLGPIPSGCDIVWDPGVRIYRVPSVLRESPVPVIATFHGGSIFSKAYCEAVPFGRLRLAWIRRRIEADWKWFRDRVAALIVPSHFAARKVARLFSLSRERIHPILHGVDHRVFTPEGPAVRRARPYLLHVTGWNALKNLKRVLAAYARLPRSTRPDLVVIFPWTWHIGQGRGILWIRRLLSPEEIARWYRGALALVFPSLEETFGFPIVEAMACGCPVITSNRSGCAEVAGDAALLVNPRSVEAIAEAMHRVAEDEALRERLRERGVIRAQAFRWDHSAVEHARLFRRVAERASCETEFVSQTTLGEGGRR